MIRKSRGNRTHPCLTRVMMSKSSETPLLGLTQVELRYRASDILMYLGSTPYSWTICHRTSEILGAVWWCSKAWRSVSEQELPFWKQTCSSLRIAHLCFKHCSSTLQNTLPGIDSSVTPCQLLQSLIFPFLGSITVTPCLQSTGTSLKCQMWLNSWRRHSTTTFVVVLLVLCCSKEPCHP